ncbi:SDR family NAD(P)-dependent oxidoreductase [Actinomadura sp. WMMB 499]|uniref:SDR family NAD(P)-dependent oxidoreductase n=1 Tax=Actinomadura sp. WMMB 499 TaxID=1219491 RepID=UPI0020C82081|nr:SDR family NAD(P)-dependent oxidoreductase [Actinomadura sp. WMMB 499]
MIAAVADVRDPHALRAALNAGVAELGRLDIVCANAGIAPMAFRELTLEEEIEQWDAVVGVNLSGTFNTLKAALPHLIEGAAAARSSSPARRPGCGGSAVRRAAGSATRRPSTAWSG